MLSFRQLISPHVQQFEQGLVGVQQQSGKPKTSGANRSSKTPRYLTSSHCLKGNEM
jgi:hypothetical protein